MARRVVSSATSSASRSVSLHGNEPGTLGSGDLPASSPEAAAQRSMTPAFVTPCAAWTLSTLACRSAMSISSLDAISAVCFTHSSTSSSFVASCASLARVSSLTRCKADDKSFRPVARALEARRNAPRVTHARSVSATPDAARYRHAAPAPAPMVTTAPGELDASARTSGRLGCDSCEARAAICSCSSRMDGSVNAAVGAP
mmetsp:Transcript_565/g.1415  ORF Transcript_565/g.1415 Transcript_565/m.1415 type:complete len:201 (+) Transcript_565:159-761(+)